MTRAERRRKQRLAEREAARGGYRSIVLRESLNELIKMDTVKIEKLWRICGGEKRGTDYAILSDVEYKIMQKNIEKTITIR